MAMPVTLFPVVCSVCETEIGSSSKEIAEPIVCSECQGEVSEEEPEPEIEREEEEK